MATYWHIIGDSEDPEAWWQENLTSGFVTVGFDKKGAQHGRKKLERYHLGDTVIAYASTIGALGVGTIADEEVLSREGSALSSHRHKRRVSWTAFAENLTNAISPNELVAAYAHGHPRQTISRVTDPTIAARLTAAFLRDAQPVESDDPLGDVIYFEGSASDALVRRVERSRMARAACLARYGDRCAACGFIGASHFGSEGAGLIHVHHLRPIHLLGTSRAVNPTEDLSPLCPNCHAFAHYGRPPHNPRPIDEIKAALGVEAMKVVHSGRC